MTYASTDWTEGAILKWIEAQVPNHIEKIKVQNTAELRKIDDWVREVRAYIY